ncbi:MAG: hypothetical protein M3Q81_04690 [bacterium]|nr:hypothetical protein [bacterium]
MKQFYIIFSWLILSLGVLFTSAASLLAFTPTPQLVTQFSEPAVIVAVSAPQNTYKRGEVKGVETIVEAEDARAHLVSRFLERYDSPLKPYDHYGEVFVQIADRYNVDFRLLPAIAMQESNLCKAIPPGSFNCLGFGVHSRGTLAFPDFESNFERAARELKANYIDIGLTTPEAIMTKYTPSSNGSWASSVNQWMAEMRYDDRKMGQTMKIDADVLEFVQPSPDAAVTP